MRNQLRDPGRRKEGSMRGRMLAFGLMSWRDHFHSFLESSRKRTCSTSMPALCLCRRFSCYWYSILFCSILFFLCSHKLAYGVYWQVRFWSRNLASYLSTYNWLDSSYGDKVRYLTWVCSFCLFFWRRGRGDTQRPCVVKVSSAWIAGTWTAMGKHDILKHLHEFNARQLLLRCSWPGMRVTKFSCLWLAALTRQQFN